MHWTDCSGLRAWIGNSGSGKLGEQTMSDDGCETCGGDCSDGTECGMNLMEEENCEKSLEQEAVIVRNRFGREEIITHEAFDDVKEVLEEQGREWEPLVRLSDLDTKWLCKTCEITFRADVDHEPACCPLCGYDPIHADNFEEFTQNGDSGE